MNVKPLIPRFVKIEPTRGFSAGLYRVHCENREQGTVTVINNETRRGKLCLPKEYTFRDTDCHRAQMDAIKRNLP